MVRDAESENARLSVGLRGYSWTRSQTAVTTCSNRGAHVKVQRATRRLGRANSNFGTTPPAESAVPFTLMIIFVMLYPPSALREALDYDVGDSR